MRVLVISVIGMYQAVESKMLTAEDLMEGLFCFDTPFYYAVSRDSFMHRKYSEETKDVIYAALELAAAEGRAIDNVQATPKGWTQLDYLLAQHGLNPIRATLTVFSPQEIKELVKMANPELRVISGYLEPAK